MRKHLCHLFFLAAFTARAQPDTTKVLFIGNSFTYVHDVPALVKGFADAAGLSFKFVMHAPGGISVGDVAQGTSAHMNNPVVYDLIRSDNWDFVSLQDNQGRFLRGYGVFPAPTTSKVIEGHLMIRDSVRFHHPCARLLWFAGWGFKNGYPGISTTGKGLIDNIYANYTYLRDTAGEIIAPIGIAWNRAMDELPLTDLWDLDEAHQSLAGSYLTAAVIFTTIYRTNTEAILFNGGLDSATARTMRRIAYRVVTDSIAPTNLASYIPTLTFGGGILTASAGYGSYHWYHNGSLISSSAANTLPVSDNGCYFVVATDANSCSARSAETCITTVGITPAFHNNGLTIYPIPANETINIDFKNLLTGKIIITDAAGKIVNETMIRSLHHEISTDDLPSAIYFLTVATNESTIHQKIVISR